MKNLILNTGFVLLITAILFSCSQKKMLVDYVDPFTGTGGHGHTFPGAVLPFGMVQLSPDNGCNGWDWCSGYHYSDSYIIGFSHTHLSGTGCCDMQDILVMPTNKKLVADTLGKGLNYMQNYKSLFDHSHETATPGYYSVRLEDSGIKAELTVTRRVGFHRYEFTRKENAKILFDLGHGVSDDIPVETKIEVVNDSVVQGFRHSSGWVPDQWVYFYAIFSKPFDSLTFIKEGEIIGKSAVVTGIRSILAMSFDFDNDQTVLIKVGISSVSEEGARNNLEAEIMHWDFDQTADEARMIWEKELSKVKAESRDKSRLQVFYTALYHSFIAPSLYSDADGRYRGLDGKIHDASGYDVYSTFSLWDTFRGEHPLLTLLQPARTSDFVNSMMAHYRESRDSLLPVWPLWGNETWCMIGYHAVPVIADAYLKGIGNFGIGEAYEAMKKSALGSRSGLDYYKTLGYIPADKEKNSVSRVLEYAFDDWCIAQVAGSLNKAEDQELFSNRAQNYRNVFDHSTRFMRGKKSNGTWNSYDELFNAVADNDYTEGNTWHYSWFVPHDVAGLIGLMGGKEAFASKLDSLFTTEMNSKYQKVNDMTGLIGQYAHGNEPSHHITYLFNYAGKPERTQELVAHLINEMYAPGPEGLCGNEDCGQMSAWYVLSSLGFYPVNPASGRFDLGRPFLDRITLTLENGKDFSIIAKNLSAGNKYVKKVMLNGETLKGYTINYEEIMKGGDMVFEMGR
jgi:predicted alpha-1,2-mannosidase